MKTAAFAAVAGCDGASLLHVFDRIELARLAGYLSPAELESSSEGRK
jgi:hypothetical protein